jgi:putative addiction module component (TIGR02574 family)
MTKTGAATGFMYQLKHPMLPGTEPVSEQRFRFRLREERACRTLVRMIKERIPELQKLSTADKFALAVELWNELSSKPDGIPVTEDQLNELDRRFEEYRQKSR